MNSETQIKVLIVDDHYMIIEGLSFRLNKEDDITVCGTAMNFEEAHKAVKDNMPDVVLMDLSLGDDSGLKLIESIKKDYPTLNAIVLTSHDESKYASRCMKVGAKGYLMKNQPFENVVEAVRKVADGGMYYSQNAMQYVMEHIVTGEKESGLPIDQLTNREFEIFKLIGEGLRPRHIADNLCISPGTVNTHCKNIIAKLGLDSMTCLIKQSTEWYKHESLP